jgi:hypothetical protein
MMMLFIAASKGKTVKIEHASGLKLSSTVIAFVFATSFSATECNTLNLDWFVRYVLVSAYI